MLDTWQMIDAVHQRFMDELLAVFNLHKKAYGWENKKLVIL